MIQNVSAKTLTSRFFNGIETRNALRFDASNVSMKRRRAGDVAGMNENGVAGSQIRRVMVEFKSERFGIGDNSDIRQRSEVLLSRLRSAVVEQIGQVFVHGPALKFHQTRVSAEIGEPGRYFRIRPIAKYIGCFPAPFACPGNAGFADFFVETLISISKVRSLVSEGIVRCNDLVARIENLVKVRLNLKWCTGSVRRRKQHGRDLHSPAVVALPAAGKIRQQQSIDEQLRVVFISNPRSGFQFQNVDAVVLAEHRVDAALNAYCCGKSFEFSLSVIFQVRMGFDKGR